MSTAQMTSTGTSVSSMKMLQAMVGIGLLCALMIVLTFETTFERIEKNKAEALEKAIFKVLPGIEKTRTFRLNAEEQFVPVIGEEEAGQIVYAGYDRDNDLVGVAIEGSGMGYADIIRILYGYDPEKEVIVGFYVLESKETPGLGDKIEKDEDFLANFEALDVDLTDNMQTLENAVVTVKSGAKENPWEVDGITGATISSRAIGDMLNASAAKWAPLIQNNLESLAFPGEEPTNSDNVQQ